MYNMISTSMMSKRDKKNCHLKMPLTPSAVYTQFEIFKFNLRVKSYSSHTDHTNHIFLLKIIQLIHKNNCMLKVLF